VNSAHFQADFMIENVAYNIRFMRDMESGRDLMTMLVNQIIAGGAADLDVLSDPVKQALR